MVLMQALQAGMKLNFRHIALEHMLDARKKYGKVLPYGCVLTKVFKFFEIKDGKGESRGDKCLYDNLNSTPWNF